jgi:hypothetical protein
MQKLLIVSKWQPCRIFGNIFWCHTPEEWLAGWLCREWVGLQCKHVFSSVTLWNECATVCCILCQRAKNDATLFPSIITGDGWNIGLWLQHRDVENVITIGDAVVNLAEDSKASSMHGRSVKWIEKISQKTW